MASSDWVNHARKMLINAILNSEDLILAVEKYVDAGTLSSDKLYGVRKAVHDASQYGYRLYVRDDVGWHHFPELEQLDLYLRLR